MDLRIDHRTISAEPGLSRVLIVDNNLATLDLTKFVLDAAGFVVESTSDAMNAMSLIATFKPDLILMDIQMPGIDGLETDPAVEGRCSDAAHRRGGIHRFAMKGDEARMRSAGCDGYIAKPIDLASFGATMRSHLRPRYDPNTRADGDDEGVGLPALPARPIAI